MSLTYAIGDIHGHVDKLIELVDRCQKNDKAASATFIFLGDYVDKGPDSAAVVAFLVMLSSRNKKVICLRGNHEQLLLDATEDEIPEALWRSNGGVKTLQSYGVSHAWELPRSHLAFFHERPLHHDDGHRFFVHAGVNPERALGDQNQHDLIWIREPFLSSECDFGRLVVHGHTPRRDGRPHIRTNRVNLDTGAAYGGPLTAAVFVPDQLVPVDFLQVT